MAEAAQPSIEGHTMTHNPLDPDDNILPLYDEMEGDSATDEPVVQLPTKEQKSLKGKEKEKAPATRRKRPLNLLELPVDIIRLIIKEVTHTNDLTALALTNSTLHRLAIPHIYARFDIVWPDTTSTVSDSKSVDALTYGLNTLCLGSSFAYRTQKLAHPGASAAPRRLQQWRGEEYAVHTRKFSLGNGPNDWVSEYMITKESGKMLGTLVAVAVQKMINLETFIWDMPTGVHSDVFMALSSLQERSPDGECKLEKIWIRWHDNSDTASSTSSSPAQPNPPQALVPAGSTLTPIGILVPATLLHPPPKPRISYAESRVEYPTFSVLPPVKSISVLDIDELSYLDELSVLVERSKDRLQELRIGIAPHAASKDFVQTWDGVQLHQVDHNAKWPGESSIGERRLGGVLGVLVGRVYDIRRRMGSKSRDKHNGDASSAPAQQPATTPGSSAGQGVDDEPTVNQAPSTSTAVVNGEASGPSGSATQAGAAGASSTLPNGGPSDAAPQDAIATDAPTGSSPAADLGTKKKKAKEDSSGDTMIFGRKRLDGKLRLQTLELERVPLSMQVCSKAIDWTVLSKLTILECAHHDMLWKLLKRQFQPTVTGPGNGAHHNKNTSHAQGSTQYHLNLKSIHTDATPLSLIAFLKETLAPNSLEVLFLQDRRRPPASQQVCVEQIFKGPIKRHRASLKKLLIDSSERLPRSGVSQDNNRWKQWILPHEVLLYLTSGRMSNLRELAVSIHYNGWHTFLQRLPNMPQLRSLYLQNIADWPAGPFEAKELALQIVDIVTLRPEIQLCYLGITNKCFEILETRVSEGSGAQTTSLGGGAGGGDGHSSSSSSSSGTNSPIVTAANGPGGAAGGAGIDSDDGTDDDDDDSDGDGGDIGDTPTTPTDADDSGSEGSSAADSDDDSFAEAERATPATRLHLREILFYDDRVAIFKARHARL